MTTTFISSFIALDFIQRNRLKILLFCSISQCIIYSKEIIFKLISKNIDTFVERYLLTSKTKLHVCGRCPLAGHVLSGQKTLEAQSPVS